MLFPLRPWKQVSRSTYKLVYDEDGVNLVGTSAGSARSLFSFVDAPHRRPRRGDESFVFIIIAERISVITVVALSWRRMRSGTDVNFK